MAKTKEIMKQLTKGKGLKIILNLWTVITMFLYSLDFFSNHKYNGVASAIGILYLGILGIYITEKEYTRWEKKKFISKFLGEGFVGFWTALMIMFALLAPFSEGRFKIPEDFTIVYTGVVAAFAISQHSKKLHNKK